MRFVSQRKTNMHDPIFMWNLKNKRNKQNENRLTDIENKWVAARGKRICRGVQRRWRRVRGTNVSYKIKKPWVCNL